MWPQSHLLPLWASDSHITWKFWLAVEAHVLPRQLSSAVGANSSERICPHELAGAMVSKKKQLKLILIAHLTPLYGDSQAHRTTRFNAGLGGLNIQASLWLNCIRAKAYGTESARVRAWGSLGGNEA